MRVKERIKYIVNHDGSPQGGKWSFDELNRKEVAQADKNSESQITKNEFVNIAEKLISDSNIEYLGDSNYFICQLITKQIIGLMIFLKIGFIYLEIMKMPLARKKFFCGIVCSPLF